MGDRGNCCCKEEAGADRRLENSTRSWAMALGDYPDYFWSAAFYVRGICGYADSGVDSRSPFLYVFDGSGDGGDRNFHCDESLRAAGRDSAGEHVLILGSVSACAARYGPDS